MILNKKRGGGTRKMKMRRVDIKERKGNEKGRGWKGVGERVYRKQKEREWKRKVRVHE